MEFEKAVKEKQHMLDDFKWITQQVLAASKNDSEIQEEETNSLLITAT